MHHVKNADIHARGGHARSYLYRVVQDHYRTEDIDLDSHNEAQC